jgi:hypothetical protein
VVYDPSTFDKDDERTEVTIPMPAYVPRARGVQAKGKFGTYWKVRTSQDEHEMGQRAADHLGISVAEYIRWITLAVSKEVLKDVQEPEPV